jgi:hypothetical protein
MAMVLLSKMNDSDDRIPRVAVSLGYVQGGD